SFFGSEVSHQVRSAFRSLGSVVCWAGPLLPQPAAARARAKAATTPAVRMRIGSPVGERSRQGGFRTRRPREGTFLLLTAFGWGTILGAWAVVMQRTLARLCS